MKLIKIAVAVSILFVQTQMLFGQTTDENSDIVGWGDLTVIVPLTKKDEGGKRVDEWVLNFGTTFRVGRNLSRPIDERVFTSINYRFNKYFTAGTGYLYRRSRLTEAPRQFEHRLQFYLLSEKKWKSVTLRNRALTIYLVRHSRPDTVVFRNRTQLNFPILKDKKEVVTPFVATEPFYDFNLKRWFRNDAYLGISKQFTPKFGADAFYIRQGFNVGALRQVNGFGVSLRVRLDRVK